MPVSHMPLSSIVVPLRRHDLRAMLRLVRQLYHISRLPAYRQLLAQELPAIARFDPGHDALMMGYDFHLTASKPQLIEVNTNAGGFNFSWLSQQHSDAVVESPYRRRLLNSFNNEWTAFNRGQRPLKRVVIIDEDMQQQHLYPEMLACRDLLREQRIRCDCVDPQQLELRSGGLFVKGEEAPVDLLYNRHCDFYLEQEALKPVRDAYLAGYLCVSPNPFAYGLLGDKRRMALWSQRELMHSLGLEDRALDLLEGMIPHSRLMADCDLEPLWQERKKLIFKPANRFAGRGVLPGKGITRTRFAQLDRAMTLVQQLVPPSQLNLPTGQRFKYDIRLYVYRDHLLGLGARLYQGQVTNLSTRDGGFAPIQLVD